MLCREVKAIARQFVLEEASRTPGFRAAHFNGSITGMADNAPWPHWKDVDLLLVHDDGSPAVAPKGPFGSNLEAGYQGLMIEGGYKPLSDYASAEAVLANPEVAHHFLSACIIADPDGTLTALMPAVREHYAERQWVLARIEREWEMAQVPQQAAPMASQIPGGAIGIAGYAFTFISALFSIAELRAPSTGSRLMVALRDQTAALGRPEMYERMIDVIGVRGMSAADFELRFQEAIDAFDDACALRRTPGPFTHKLHLHLRPYFVESIEALRSAGELDAARGFLVPFYNAIAFVNIVDGNDQQRALWSERIQSYLALMGVHDPGEGARRLEAAFAIQDDAHQLALEVASTNPAVLDD